MIFTPRVYQGLIRDFGIHHYRSNIWAGMGLGKTAASLDIYDTLRMFGMVKRVLVTGPRRVALSAWPDEHHKWIDTFGHLSIAAAIGTPDQRKRALAMNAHVTTINYENLEWLAEGYGDRWPFDMVIADESTRLKGLRIGILTSKLGNEFIRGQGSTRAKALSKVAFKHVRHWVNLTGLAAPNGIVDLWGQQFFVDMGRRLGTSFKAFQDRYFYGARGPDGYEMLIPKPHAQAEIEGLMRDCTIAIDAKDYFDIKDPIESLIMVDLPPKARAAYMTMETDLFAEIREHRIDVFAQGAKSQKLLQIANGTAWINRNENHWEPVHDVKLDALRSVMEEAAGEPVLIRYTHVPDKERILAAFPKVKFFDDKPETQAKWNRGEIAGLLTHAASTGHGLSLQDGGRILCDFSSDFDLEEDAQILERIGPTRQMQSGHNRAVFRRRIVARDTVEELSVLPRLKTKMSVEAALREAMKVRKQ